MLVSAVETPKCLNDACFAAISLEFRHLKALSPKSLKEPL